MGFLVAWAQISMLVTLEFLIGVFQHILLLIFLENSKTAKRRKMHEIPGLFLCKNYTYEKVVLIF